MQRSYLFLQGPHGPFFKQLGRKLRDQGANVFRINFNGGDWVDWLGLGSSNFVGTQSEWDEHVRAFFIRHQITDLVVYGDCRSLHKKAIVVARDLGIRIHVFEEGYIRPCWISLEEGGVNGNSPLFGKIIEQLPDLESCNDEHDSQRVGPAMRWILFYCLRYYLFKSLWSLRFRNYIRHRPFRSYQELLLWVGNILHMPLLHMRSRKRRKELSGGCKPYYLGILQLDSDAQLREHSNYLSMADYINDVLRSFAAHAPKDSLLVFKKHPFDPGAIPYETLVCLEAYSLGIRERIVFLHSGVLPDLIKDSQGVVLMNSTVGTSALHHGKPTIVLGQAIYDLPGLTWQGGLNRFWNEAQSPDQDLFRRYRSLLLRKVLINGGFYTGLGRQLAVSAAIRCFEDIGVAPESECRRG